jgi:hypothetical protein
MGPIYSIRPMNPWEARPGSPGYAVLHAMPTPALDSGLLREIRPSEPLCGVQRRDFFARSRSNEVSTRHNLSARGRGLTVFLFGSSPNRGS